MFERALAMMIQRSRTTNVASLASTLSPELRDAEPFLFANKKPPEGGLSVADRPDHQAAAAAVWFFRR